MSGDEPRRVVAECERCGAAYAGREWPDGTVRVIGRNGCRCGASSFVARDVGDGAREPTAE
ncbi:hypothetical protein G9464_05140 [Halostella sp. JP-L12]|uniref:hypothetical protein n=1 Tax=Halostella TaxID=1843185 RepID=UPI000EF7CF2C|nr:MULTISPECIES: hypothetical protein [Halostella]NHN46980.1 hypothetical protein [Halostella sp. JP-L12]